MNIKTQLRELAARSERVVELGDFDPSRLPPEFVAKIERMREAKLKDPNYANVNGYIVKASNRAAVEDIVKKGGRPNIRDGNVVAAYFPVQQKKEFALVRDSNGQLVEDNGGSGLKTAAKVGLGAAGAAGAAVLGTRAYHGHKAIMKVGAEQFARKAGHDASRGVGPINDRLAKYSAANRASAADFGRIGFLDKVKAAYGSAGNATPGKLAITAQNSARQGWMGKLGKVGNFLTKF